MIQLGCQKDTEDSFHSYQLDNRGLIAVVTKRATSSSDSALLASGSCLPESMSQRYPRTNDGSQYWNQQRRRLEQHGLQVVTNCYTITIVPAEKNLEIIQYRVQIDHLRWECDETTGAKRLVINERRKSFFVEPETSTTSAPGDATEDEARKNRSSQASIRILNKCLEDRENNDSTKQVFVRSNLVSCSCCTFSTSF
jgi:hypothetical protein